MSLKNQTVMTSHAELINGVIEEETAIFRARCEQTFQEMNADCEHSMQHWHRHIDNVGVFCKVTPFCHWDKSNNMCVVDVYNSRTLNMLRDRCRQAIERLV